jgi:hypothetical protein
VGWLIGQPAGFQPVNAERFLPGDGSAYQSSPSSSSRVTFALWRAFAVRGPAAAIFCIARGVERRPVFDRRPRRPNATHCQRERLGAGEGAFPSGDVVRTYRRGPGAFRTFAAQ